MSDAPEIAPHVQAAVDRLTAELDGVAVFEGSRPHDVQRCVVVREVAGGTASPMLTRPYAHVGIPFHTYAVGRFPGHAKALRDLVVAALTSEPLTVEGRALPPLEWAPMGVDREDEPSPTVWSGVDRWVIPATDGQDAA